MEGLKKEKIREKKLLERRLGKYSMISGSLKIFCPPNMKSWIIGKDPDTRKDWGHEEKGMTEDEMVGWRHWLNHESEQTLGDGERQGSLVCCSPWGHKEPDRTEWLNGNKGLSDLYSRDCKLPETSGLCVFRWICGCKAIHCLNSVLTIWRSQCSL